MKKIIVTLCFGLFSHATWAIDLATSMGQPNPHLDFVQERVVQSTSHVDGPYETVTSTHAYSIFARTGVKSTVLFSDVNARGITFASAIQQSIWAAGENRIPVMMFITGPHQNRDCQEMAKYPGTLFVLPAGSSGMELPSAGYESCEARNIIVVASLNGSLTDLDRRSNYGENRVAMAAPSVAIPVIHPDGTPGRASNGTMAVSLVAGKLAAYAQEFPDLRGEALWQGFVANHAVHLGRLEGKVQGSLALKD